MGGWPGVCVCRVCVCVCGGGVLGAGAGMRLHFVDNLCQQPIIVGVYTAEPFIHSKQRLFSLPWLNRDECLRQSHCGSAFLWGPGRRLFGPRVIQPRNSFIAIFSPPTPSYPPPFSLTPIDLALNGTGSQLRCMGKSR